LEHDFAWCWNLEGSESWSETPGQFGKLIRNTWTFRKVDQ
jgi:hypothetical protein